MQKKSQSLKKSILSRIYGRGRGCVFTPKEFLDLGTRGGVGVALFELARAGTIRTIARGVYEYPKSSRLLGVLPPRPDAVARALAVTADVRLQPTGAYAANLLGLSEQVPARITYYTDGPTKTVRVGQQTITLKRTTHRNMRLHDSVSGLVVQALRHIGRNNLNATHVDVLRQRLTAEEKADLISAAKWVPAWVAKALRAVAEIE